MSDAAVMEMPDASCADTRIRLLSNPSFDRGPGNGWIESAASAVITAQEGSLPVTPHTGTYAAWLGGVPSVTDALHQTVSIPPGARSLQLTGYWVIQTEETSSTPIDRFTISLRDGTNGLLEEIGSFSNADARSPWTQFTFVPAGDYAGHNIRLHFESVLDGLDNTNFLFDTLTLTVTACQ